VERNGWSFKKWSDAERNGLRLKEMVGGRKKWLEVERNGWRLKEMVGG